ncbi:MAG TPA: hypothetical protein VM262_12005, partial [Acidimicrobiales bacterium]|nr:hypothetical protein [Acidimicrobiales bacterium]
MRSSGRWSVVLLALALLASACGSTAQQTGVATTGGGLPAADANAGGLSPSATGAGTAAGGSSTA